MITTLNPNVSVNNNNNPNLLSLLQASLTGNNAAVGMSPQQAPMPLAFPTSGNAGVASMPFSVGASPINGNGQSVFAGMPNPQVNPQAMQGGQQPLAFTQGTNTGLASNGGNELGMPGLEQFLASVNAQMPTSTAGSAMSAQQQGMAPTAQPTIIAVDRGAIEQLQANNSIPSEEPSEEAELATKVVALEKQIKAQEKDSKKSQLQKDSIAKIAKLEDQLNAMKAPKDEEITKRLSKLEDNITNIKTASAKDNAKDDAPPAPVAT